MNSYLVRWTRNGQGKSYYVIETEYDMRDKIEYSFEHKGRTHTYSFSYKPITHEIEVNVLKSYFPRAYSDINTSTLLKMGKISPDNIKETLMYAGVLSK